MYPEKAILEFIYTNKLIFQEFGLLIVFLSSALESLPLIGFFVPGQTILVLAAVFARLGLFSIWHVIIFGILASFLGDVLAFLLGKKYETSTMKIISRFIGHERIEKTKKITREHSGKTVFLGRFNSFTRALSPFFAGIADIGTGKFLCLALGASILWSVSFSVLGFVLGEGFLIIVPAIGKFFAIATAIAIFVLYLAEEAKKRGVKFRKNQIILFIVSIISLYAFAIIAQNVSDHGILSIIDSQISALVAPSRNRFILSSLWWLGWIGPWTFSAIAAIPILILLLYRKYEDFFYLLFSLGISGLSVLILKAIFSRPRPLIRHFFPESSSSFPSGHAVIATVFFLSLCYLAKKYLKNWEFILLSILSGVMIFLVAFSRVYFGEHWASDVLGGFCFGVFFYTSSLVYVEIIPEIYQKIKNKIR